MSTDNTPKETPRGDFDCCLNPNCDCTLADLVADTLMVNGTAYSLNPGNVGIPNLVVVGRIQSGQMVELYMDDRYVDALTDEVTC